MKRPTLPLIWPRRWWSAFVAAVYRLGLVESYPRRTLEVWVEFSGGPYDGLRRMVPARHLRAGLSLPVMASRATSFAATGQLDAEPQNDIDIATYRFTGFVHEVGERPWPVFIFEEVP